MLLNVQRNGNCSTPAPMLSLLSPAIWLPSIFMAKILDGTATAKEIRAEVAQGVAELHRNHGVTAGLAAILVGDDPGSAIYVRNKGRACQEVGIYSVTFHLPESTSQEELFQLVDKLNNDCKFHGILV